MRIQEFTCFAAAAGGGNPALVIADGPSGLAKRLRLARERALTCVFHDSADAPGALVGAIA